ncbi:MAG: UDP-glucose/GDP-mannose dehydrogenase family protein, partial [Elusimicrobia bacterium]|nr:UDP-glucose/GDP-mannose dehydrogenase family protein [Elusimicrobiota bacterium]
MRICVVGTGYVGLVTGACLSDLGNQVYCIDNNEKKINLLKKGVLPIYEPGLTEVVKKNVQQKRLIFSCQIRDGVRNSDIIFICVNTPPN